MERLFDLAGIDYTIDEWNGFKKIDFDFNGREALLICPEKAVEGNKWLYKTEYFGAFPEFEIEMLKRGYTPEELGKFWGGNFLRVWEEIINVSKKM